MFKKLLLCLAPAVFLFATTGCMGLDDDIDLKTVIEYSLKADDSTTSSSTSDGSASGYFSTHDLKGNYYTQEIFTEADYTFVNIWGTFCGPCISEMPDLGDLSREYADSNIQFVGIVCDAFDGDDTNVDWAKEIVSRTNADYTHLLLSYSVGEWKVNDCEYVPTTLIVDSNGNILYETVGSHSKSEWRSILNKYTN